MRGLREVIFTGMAMNVQFRLLEDSDMQAVLDLSILAWEPVFAAWQQILGPRLYPLAIYPDWRKSQREVVQNICKDEKIITWAAVVDGTVVGFVCYEINDQTKVGEVQLLAVHPDYQNQGIGTELNLLALAKLQESGMKLAVVGTGGDDGHAPARKCYEKAGYTGLPHVQYYKEL
jgi:ribosomal protein S18 acetylase RimI-like enzyme